MSVVPVVLALGIVLVVSAHSQPISPPLIEWQRVFGNSEDDILGAAQQTSDGGFVLGGTSNPPADGNKTCQGFGFVDYWVVRLDPNGNRLWDRCFGGLSFDSLTSLQETRNGGFIVGGLSWSTNGGNKATTHYGSRASADFWVLHLGQAGNKAWEQNYGGVFDDSLRSIFQTADNGFLLCGSSSSPISGNKTATNYGSGLSASSDYWVVRLDSGGQKLWERTFGGGGQDRAWCAHRTSDGGLVLGGGSNSGPSGTKSSANLGDYDFWIVRTDSNGNKLWDRSFGGIYDDTLYALAEMPDGGFMLVGRSSSPPGGNKTSTDYGNADFWVVRIDANGIKLWDQTFGGSADDFPAAVAVTADSGVIIGGRSFSVISGNKLSVNYGACDFWVIRLDCGGQKMWEKTYGGSRTDGIESLQQTLDGGFLLAGWSSSSANGNKTEPALGFQGDFWVIKVGPEQPELRLFDPPIVADGLRLTLTGIKNLSYCIEWSSNLSNWTSLQTNRMANSNLEILDSSVTNSIQRFYRARQVP